MAQSSICQGFREPLPSVEEPGAHAFAERNRYSVDMSPTTRHASAVPSVFILTRHHMPRTWTSKISPATIATGSRPGAAIAQPPAVGNLQSFAANQHRAALFEKG
jgi:hypothetical protein